VTSASAIRLLESLVDDDSHRVAGNSLVGLHVVGVPGVLARLTEMAIHRNPKCRCTAAWAIGRVGDAIFVPLLNLLVTDRDPGVRSASLRALIQIRKSDDRTFEEIKEQALEISLTPELTNDELAENDIPIIPPLCGIQPQTGWIEFLHGTKLAV
jgi:HEAT repeat protein